MEELTKKPQQKDSDSSQPRITGSAPDIANFVFRAPRGSSIGVKEALATWLGLEDAGINDLGTLPGERNGHRLLALRYLIANGPLWIPSFNWREPLSAVLEENGQSAAEIRKSLQKVETLNASITELRATILKDGEPGEEWVDALLKGRNGTLESIGDLKTVRALIVFDSFPGLRARAREKLRERSVALSRSKDLADFLYLATCELDRYPATTVTAGQLKYMIVADKGEMGVRAVREAMALGKIPVVLFSAQDDAKSLQVRLAKKSNGFTIGLQGNFRESYASYTQITERVLEEFQRRFKNKWKRELARAAIYPGYGPLAENAAAIRHFRRHGLIFVGPMQDVVERAGDKREFRKIAQALDPQAVTPGVIIDSNEPAEIIARVKQGLQKKEFELPGRIKAANGGGGRGQAVVRDAAGINAAVSKVLGEIQSYGWDQGVMFEQNIPETIHLEVQIMRDRYGNTRHFGMRDCSEQRASQKIQEEAPPALLVTQPELRERIEKTAVRIADEAGYCGAGTVELMYKNGRFFFLEMNTRIQVEHPVTEMSHAIDRGKGKGLEALNLVQWQMRIANGEAIDFEQKQVRQTHVAREFRINAESWMANLKDSRDGHPGLFVPNAGIFDRIKVPARAELLKELRSKGIQDIAIRFDTGFEKGDTLVNKDPTFGKLIVAIAVSENNDRAYELLRLACIVALNRTQIRGRQVRPDGSVIPKTEFQTNIPAHLRILEADVLRRHSVFDDQGRHVNWVVGMLRADVAH